MRGSKYAILLLLSLVAAHAAEIETHKVQLRHSGINSNKPKGYTLYQTRDSEGLITGYTMVVDSVVCKEAVCEVVGVTMAWDALGKYEDYRLEKEGTHLEKVEADWEDKAAPDGVPFTDADYKKLDQILKDRHSALQTQTLESMSPGSQNDEVDVVSGATPLNLKEAVVEGAALTCFHLWHWANGEVGAAARELTQKSCNEKLLNSFLFSDKPHYVLFGRSVRCA